MTISKTGKAWECKKFGDPSDVLHAIDREVPANIQKGFVLVKVANIALNPLDYKWCRGNYSFAIDCPYVIGFDFSGTIVKCGKNAKFGEGDKVFGCAGANGMKKHQGGTCSEYVLVSCEQIALKPVTIDFKQAAALPMVCGTHYDCERIAKLEKGQRVLVLGASGGVGIHAIQMLKAKGLHITAVCSSKNAKTVIGYGADDHIDYNSCPDFSAAWQGDVIFDYSPSGGYHNWCKAKQCLKKHGRFVAISGDNPDVKWNFCKVMAMMCKANFRQGYKLVLANITRAKLEAVGKLVTNGDLTPVVDCVYPFEKVPKAFEHLMSKRAVGKIIIDMPANADSAPVFSVAPLPPAALQPE